MTAGGYGAPDRCGAHRTGATRAAWTAPHPVICPYTVRVAGTEPLVRIAAAAVVAIGGAVAVPR